MIFLFFFLIDSLENIGNGLGSSIQNNTPILKVIYLTSSTHIGKFVKQKKSIIHSLAWNASKLYNQHEILIDVPNIGESNVKYDCLEMFNMLNC